MLPTTEMCCGGERRRKRVKESPVKQVKHKRTIFCEAHSTAKADTFATGK